MPETPGGATTAGGPETDGGPTTAGGAIPPGAASGASSQAKMRRPDGSIRGTRISAQDVCSSASAEQTSVAVQAVRMSCGGAPRVTHTARVLVRQRRMALLQTYQQNFKQEAFEERAARTGAKQRFYNPHRPQAFPVRWQRRRAGAAHSLAESTTREAAIDALTDCAKKKAPSRSIVGLRQRTLPGAWRWSSC